MPKRKNGIYKSTHSPIEMPNLEWSRVKMNPRSSARIVGVLFIIATAAPLMSVAFVPLMLGPDDLAKVWLLAASENQIRIGALLEFTMAVAVAAIPICMYPILKKYNESMALGYVVGRLVEGLMFTIGIISLLTLLTLSNEYASAGAPSAAYYQTIGTMLLAVRSWQSVFAQFCFSLGSLMFYYILYKSKLVPRWLSGWSLIGAVLFLGSAFLAMFGYGSESTIYLLFNAPGGVGEMVFAVWLIVKGFNPSAIASDPVITN
jgi:hypothetical protein